MFDREKIRHSFGRNAHRYDGLASVQKLVVERLATLVLQQCPPGTVHNFLDVGCGTGAMLSSLKYLYPGATGIGLDLAFEMARAASGVAGTVSGDAEHLPFRGASLDLVVSASTLQWLDGFETCLSEFARVVTPGGAVCVAFFGGETLRELHHSYQLVLGGRCGGGDARLGRLHRFRGGDDLSRALEGSGLHQICLFSERYVDLKKGLFDLLGSIKGIGAGPGGGGTGGLGWRGVLNEVERCYRQEYGRDDGMMPATYETVYLVAEKR